MKKGRDRDTEENKRLYFHEKVTYDIIQKGEKVTKKVFLNILD